MNEVAFLAGVLAGVGPAIVTVVLHRRRGGRRGVEGYDHADMEETN